MTTEATKEKRLVLLKNVRLMFTDSIKTAKATVTNGVPKHTCVPLLEADTPEFDENLRKVVGALQACGEEGWKKADFYKSLAENKPDRLSFRRGEKCRNQETGEIYKGFEGNIAITPCSGPGGSKNPKRPLIMARKKNDWVWNPDRGFQNEGRINDVVYSGVRADVKIEFYPVSGSDQGGNGIFATIQLIRSREEGERIGGGYTFSDEEMDEFDDLEGGDDTDDLGI